MSISDLFTLDSPWEIIIHQYKLRIAITFCDDKSVDLEKVKDVFCHCEIFAQLKS